MSSDILPPTANDQEQTKISTYDFVKQFRHHDDDIVCVRTLPPRGVLDEERRQKNHFFHVRDFKDPRTLEKLRGWNSRFGIYFVVGVGGTLGSQIRYFRTIFIEWDKIPMDKQYEQLAACPLEPSLCIETNNGPHTYWLCIENILPADWIARQKGLNQNFENSDSTLTDLPQVMRLPNSDHLRIDGYEKSQAPQDWKDIPPEKILRKPIVLGRYSSLKRYSLEELNVFPRVQEESKKSYSFGHSNNNSGLYTREALIRELGNRIMAHPSARKNKDGNWDCRGVCHVHPGQSETSLVYFPETNHVYCHSKCELATILTAFDLPTEPDSDGKIIVKGGSADENVKQLEWLLAKETERHPATGIYQRGGQLVQMYRLREVEKIKKRGIVYPKGMLQINAIEPECLAARSTRAAHFVRYDEKQKDYVTIDGPTKLARVLARDPSRWQNIAPLTGVIEVPTFRPDGSIIQHAGYDETTGLYLDFGGIDFPPIPEKPTKDQARAALNKLKEPLKDFPFPKDSGSLSVSLAAMLTVVVRPALDSAPLFAMSAPKGGSGKTLLSKVISFMGTGRDPVLITQNTDPAEDKKQLITVLMKGSTVVCFDNCEAPLKSAPLCAILTSSQYSDRLLGTNMEITAPTTNTLWIATGNNLKIDGDLCTRSLLATIDPKMESPEDREFKVDLLNDYIPKHRVEMIVAALTIVRAYIMAREKEKVKVTQLGRFEQWSAWIREALVWLDETDPCVTRDEIKRDNTQSVQLINLLLAWNYQYGAKPKTTADVMKDIETSRSNSYSRTDADRALEAAVRAVAEDHGTISGERFVKYLRDNRDRIEGEMRFERYGAGHAGFAKWMVAWMGKPEERPTTDDAF